MSHLIVTGTGPTRRGLVSAISGGLSELGCNILDSAQFNDEETGRFFLRMVIRPETGSTRRDVESELARISAATGLALEAHEAPARMRMIVMVSKFGHCLNDLLYRWRIGALPVEIAGVYMWSFLEQGVSLGIALGPDRGNLFGRAARFTMVPK